MMNCSKMSLLIDDLLAEYKRCKPLISNKIAKLCNASSGIGTVLLKKVTVCPGIIKNSIANNNCKTDALEEKFQKSNPFSL